MVGTRGPHGSSQHGNWERREGLSGGTRPKSASPEFWHLLRGRQDLPSCKQDAEGAGQDQSGTSEFRLGPGSLQLGSRAIWTLAWAPWEPALALSGHGVCLAWSRGAGKGGAAAPSPLGSGGQWGACLWQRLLQGPSTGPVLLLGQTPEEGHRPLQLGRNSAVVWRASLCPPHLASVWGEQLDNEADKMPRKVPRLWQSPAPHGPPFADGADAADLGRLLAEELQPAEIALASAEQRPGRGGPGWGGGCLPPSLVIRLDFAEVSVRVRSSLAMKLQSASTAWCFCTGFAPPEHGRRQGRGEGAVPTQGGSDQLPLSSLPITEVQPAVCPFRC